jgi:hypothetical protein
LLSPSEDAAKGEGSRRSVLRKTITKFSLDVERNPPVHTEDKQKTEWTTKHQAAVIVPIWFLVGFFSFITVPWTEDGESLTGVDALYLQVQIVTTVGYGDMAPKHTVGRVFTACYVLTTVAIASGLIGELTETLITSQSESVRQQIEREQRDDDDDGPSFFEKYSSLLNALGFFVGILLIGIVFYCLVEDKNVADSFYMCIVTATTVGFGDVVPDSEEGRLFMTVWMFFGVAATGRLVAVITAELLKLKSEMKIHSLSESLLDEIDSSGDGEVTELEFVCYMLKKYELVDEDLLQGFIENFRQLDKDGSGILTANDLRSWAQHHTEARSRKSILVSPRLNAEGYKEMPPQVSPADYA